MVLTSNPAGSEAELVKQWRATAEASWYQQGHVGWALLGEQLVRHGRQGSGKECRCGTEGVLAME